MGHYTRGALDLQPGDVVAVPAGPSGYHFAIVSNLLGIDGKPYVIWGSPTGAEPVRETPWEEFTRGEDAWRTEIEGSRHWTRVLREARARIGEPFEHRQLIQWAHGLAVEDEPRVKRPRPPTAAPPPKALAAAAIAGVALAGVALVLKALLRR